MNQVGKRYLTAMFVAGVAYALTLIGALTVLQLDSPVLLRYFTMLIPVLPIIYGMRAYARFLRGIDELQQRIQLDGLTFAMSSTAILTVAWGFLEIAGAPQLSVLWVFPIMVWFWGLGTAFATRRYR